MNKYFFLLLLFIAYSHATAAQWTNTLMKDATTYVYADTVYIRADPSKTKNPIDTLRAGDLVKVLDQKAQTLTVKGVSAPWLQVSYTKSGTEMQGYVWAGALAPRPLRKGDTKIIYGCNRIAMRDTVIEETKQQMKIFMLGIKVYKAGNRVAYLQYPLQYDENEFSYTDATINTGKGLSNVSLMAAISFGGQACAMPYETYYFVLCNDQVIPLTNTFSVSDAGSYHHSEKLVFPADPGGKPGMILYSEQTEEATDKMDKNGEPFYKTKKKSKQFSWNGSKIVEIKK